MYEFAIAVGMFGGLLSYEFLGFSPGGIITPGYLALFVDQPVRIAGTLLIALATFGIIRLLSSWIILYGRRRFVVTMLVSFLLRWAWDELVMRIPVPVPELRVIGYIIPGLIANDLERQGITGTLSSLTVVTVFVRLLMLVVGPWMAA